MSNRGKIVTVATTKGGAGKTTTSACLGDALAMLGFKVAFLDLDPNHNLANWFQKAQAIVAQGGKPEDHFPGIHLETLDEEEEIVRVSRRLAEAYDIVILDGAGAKTQALYVAAGASHMVVIPATPSEDDFKEAIKTRKMVASASEMIAERIGKEFDIPTRILINETQTNTDVHKHIAQQLERGNFQVFEGALGFRTIFRKARFAATTPVRAEPQGAAAKEIFAIAAELIEILGLKSPVAVEEAAE